MSALDEYIKNKKRDKFWILSDGERENIIDLAIERIEDLNDIINNFGILGNEFDRMHTKVDSRYAAERIFSVKFQDD